MKDIFASIVTIGDELLIGQVIDTNSSFIARSLNAAGIMVRSRLAVGDRFEDIFEALQTESAHSQIILITGGLGPTKDDITKAALCKYFNSELTFNEAAFANVKYRFESIYKKPVTEPNRLQAMVPDRCEVLQNSRGTAPGMIFEKEGVIYVSMPGVPYEMEGMMERVISMLRKQFDLPVIIHKNILTAGIGESALAERISSFEDGLPKHVRLAYLPSFGMVRLRLSVSARDEQQIEEIEKLHTELMEIAGPYVVSIDDKTLQEAVGDLLLRYGRTVSTAESCTGGAIASLLASVPGASAYFEGSVVSYSNEIKTSVLGVEADTLQNKGAVSERTVIEMVAGALRILKTDYSVAVSGIMGPAGGSSEKPVGTVWLAAGNQNKTKTLRIHLRYNRAKNIEITCTQALNLLREFILESEE